MTNDITELAQSLKAAAENAIGAHERLAAYPYGEIIDISQHEDEQIDIDINDLNEFNKEANPVNILALVEALEKAQRRIAELEGVDSEPVAEVIQKLNGYDRPLYLVAIESEVEEGDVLYRHAQQPVVSELQPLVSEVGAQVSEQPATVVPDEQHSERFDWTFGQWAEHVGGRHQGDDPANYYEFGSFMAVAAMLCQFGTVQQKLGWNACRAAMLQAGNSPVIPGRWIPVSERMPEKNGTYQVWNGKHVGAVPFLFGSFQCLNSEQVTHWMPTAKPPREVK